MNAILFGLVDSEVSSAPGYYLVSPSIGSRMITGVSIRGTVLTSGQVVGIVQCGGRGTNVEYGFFEADQDMVSVFEPDDSTRNQLIQACPAGATLNWIAQKAGVVGVRYRPATATRINASTIVATDRWTSRSSEYPVTTELSVSDFVVGDIILIGSWPDKRVQVEGWWQPSSGETIVHYNYPPPFVIQMPVTSVKIRLRMTALEITTYEWPLGEPSALSVLFAGQTYAIPAYLQTIPPGVRYRTFLSSAAELQANNVSFVVDAPGSQEYAMTTSPDINTGSNPPHTVKATYRASVFS